MVNEGSRSKGGVNRRAPQRKRPAPPKGQRGTVVYEFVDRSYCAIVVQPVTPVAGNAHG